MTFLLDGNFPKGACGLLASMGRHCHDFRGSDLEGAPDTTVVEVAQQLRAVILTTDRDFYHTLHHQHPDHFGVVVIALKQPNRVSVLSRLEWLLRRIDEAHFPKRAFQLRDATWIARPPLPQ